MKHTDALAHTFLIILVPVTVGGLILLRARRTYARDVATAMASMQATGTGSMRASSRPGTRRAA